MGTNLKKREGLRGLSIGSIVITGFMAVGISACTQEAEQATAPAMPMQKGGLDQTGAYDAVEGWFKTGIDRWDQPPTALVVDNPDRIFVAVSDQLRTQPNSLMFNADGTVLDERSTTSEKPDSEKTHVHQILVVNGNGEVTEDWSQWDDQFILPHNLFINPFDPERHLWVVDLGHMVFKFTNDGKELVMKLGEKGVGAWDETHFNMPSSLAFLPDGSFLVADGYVNGRIAKFDKDGNYVSEFGSKGSGPGQFDLVHSLAIDAQGRIYAADRRNHRIQVFDADGNFLDEWTNVGSPTRLVITENQHLWMSDADYNRFAKFDLNGVLQTYWGVTGKAPGAFDNLHNFDVAEDGSLFVADAWNNRIQKFTPKEHADPERLIGQQFIPAM
jgi:DNA-binding beta-propeller fold protein YncE